VRTRLRWRALQVLLVLSVLAAAVGLGWWVHPGAGLLLAGLSGVAFALLIDDGSGGAS
jgi:membrane associated rhomboid family serine protease